ncbi:MAG: 1-acyl-sn-glycerol-3-phosphate acyltransferase, partial [Phycisphaerales bacterium]|nr:1-acyl-sn-glycerol-3-phosphate acyltransferase [Phycisphaerales bacterium]
MFDRARRSPGRSLWYFLVPWGLGRKATSQYCRICFHMRTFGRENIPRTGPVLYVCNHQSFLDLMACGGMCADRPFTPMARKTLWCNRIMSWYLDQYFAIPVDQDGGAGTAAVKSALRELSEGRCVLIYPEGSRSDDGLMLPFERGLMVLIKRGKAPVVPLAIDGAYECWARTSSKPKLSGHLSIIAGEPIMPEDLLRDGV